MYFPFMKCYETPSIVLEVVIFEMQDLKTSMMEIKATQNDLQRSLKCIRGRFMF